MIKFISEEEVLDGAGVDMVVCATWEKCQKGPFMDNVQTVCTGCGKAIGHRSYVPKSPPKYCLECVIGILNAH